MAEGRVDFETSTNQCYIWLVWLKDKALRKAAHCEGPYTSQRWIAPGTRKRLERSEDYDFTPADQEIPRLAAPLFDLQGEQL